VPCDLRRHIPLDFEQSIVAVRAGKKVERITDAIEQAPAQLQGHDGVSEGRRRRFTDNCRDLGLMLGECPRIGGGEMLGGNAVERGNPAASGPVLQ